MSPDASMFYEENDKTGKLHIVYLSTQVAAIFQELKALAGESELVLPGRSSIRGRMRPNFAREISVLLGHKYDFVLHGETPISLAIRFRLRLSTG